MNRRIALKNVALTFGTLFSTPAWANAWTVDSLPEIKKLPFAETLHQLVDALIPQTTIADGNSSGAVAPGAVAPGAAELGVDKFVMVMVNNCTPDNQQMVFMKQLGLVDEFSISKFEKPFAELNNIKKAECLRMISVSELPEWKTFFGILKRYTVHGYQSSEYVMTKNGYEFIPGSFSGCVDLV